MASTANKKNRRSIRKTLLDGDVAFQVTEAYKNLRTNLTFALSTKPSKVFVVSSALTSEGKSTVAANISITMAEADVKALLIDCDLRKPVQHKIFKVSNEKGLSTLLGVYIPLKKWYTRTSPIILTSSPAALSLPTHRSCWQVTR